MSDDRKEVTERLRLTVAYDGRAFRGWQSQPTADSVQDHLERALEKLCGRRIVVYGAGRTDAGVHALAQVAHINVPRGKMETRKWLLALNAQLVPEVRVMRVQRAKPDFEAQFSACGKVYSYRIWAAPALQPLEIGRVWHIPTALDLSLMRQAAAKLVGTHDFARLAARRQKEPEDTVRTIDSIRISRRGPLITLRFQGPGFLYKMVRMLTGSIARCGQGRAPLSWIDELLESKSATKSHFVAPAEGLYLEKVLY